MGLLILVVARAILLSLWDCALSETSDWWVEWDSKSWAKGENQTLSTCSNQRSRKNICYSWRSSQSNKWHELCTTWSWHANIL